MYRVINAFTWNVIENVSLEEAMFFHSLGFYNVYDGTVWVEFY